jgi:glycosyltransferase involved in cell wall biosynthesis
MRRPGVSVVINFYEAEAYLEEAIDSVFAQTYHDWELLLVDDGSTDGGTAVARACAARHPDRVRYLEHPAHANLGGAAARNLGIRSARGDLVAFLDADDVWLPDKLARQTDVLERFPDAAMVMGLALVWHSWETGRVDSDRVKTYKFGGNRLVDPPAILESFLRSPGATPFPSATMIRREVAEAVGGFAEQVRGTHDDQAFFAKVCLKHRVFVADDIVFRYRVHENSLCHQEAKRGETETARRRFLEWLEACLEGEVERESPLWLELRRQLLPYRRPHLHRASLLASAARRRFARLVLAAARRLVPTGAIAALGRRLW